MMIKVSVALILALELSAAAADFPSPDKRLVARVGSLKSGESQFVIGRSHGKALFQKSFGSKDGEHGEVITRSEWTSNSRFFVFITEHAGGHGPMMHPIYFWDRRDNQLRMLDYVVGGVTSGFKLDAPDIVSGERISATSATMEEDFRISLSSAARIYRQRNIGLNGRRP